MDWTAVGAIGELVGGVVVLASIFYLARQIRQNTRQTQLASIQAINASNDSAFDPIYIPENSAIFARGQRSLGELTDDERIVFDMLMTRLFASFDTTTFQYTNGVFDDELYWGTARFYSKFITSPGGAEWFTAQRGVFSEASVRNLLSQRPKNSATDAGQPGEQDT